MKLRLPNQIKIFAIQYSDISEEGLIFPGGDIAKAGNISVLDWMENTAPERYLSDGEERRYLWYPEA